MSIQAEGSSTAEHIAKTAKTAFEESQLVSSSERVRALNEIRRELEHSKAEILEANKRDLEVRVALRIACDWWLMAEGGNRQRKQRSMRGGCRLHS